MSLHSIRRAGRKRTIRTVRDPRAWIDNMTALAQDQIDDLGRAYHGALAAMRTGHGDEGSWSTLACALNVALLLCEAGIGRNVILQVQYAQAALMACRARVAKTGKWLFDGEQMQKVTTAINLHDEQIANATRGEVSRALREVNRRVRAGEVMV